MRSGLIFFAKNMAKPDIVLGQTRAQLRHRVQTAVPSSKSVISLK